MRVDDNLPMELIIDCLVESSAPNLVTILKERAEKVMEPDDNVIHCSVCACSEHAQFCCLIHYYYVM